MNAAAQEFELPWPPSVNHYYRHVGPRVLISRDGRRYRETVVAMFRNAGVFMYCCPVEIAIELYPPDSRRRDVDNSLKCLLDTLTHAGLYEDDSQIRKLTVTKHNPMPPAGMAHIQVKCRQQTEMVRNQQNKMAPSPAAWHRFFWHFLLILSYFLEKTS